MLGRNVRNVSLVDVSGRNVSLVDLSGRDASLVHGMNNVKAGQESEDESIEAFSWQTQDVTVELPILSPTDDDSKVTEMEETIMFDNSNMGMLVSFFRMCHPIGTFINEEIVSTFLASISLKVDQFFPSLLKALRVLLVPFSSLGSASGESPR